MTLFQDTGQTEAQRQNEAATLIEMLLEMMDQGKFTERETEFISSMSQGWPAVTPKQLFWLRDIKDKYL